MPKAMRIQAPEFFRGFFLPETKKKNPVETGFSV